MDPYPDHKHIFILFLDLPDETIKLYLSHNNITRYIHIFIDYLLIHFVEFLIMLIQSSGSLSRGYPLVLQEIIFPFEHLTFNILLCYVC